TNSPTTSVRRPLAGPSRRSGGLRSSPLSRTEPSPPSRWPRRGSSLRSGSSRRAARASPRMARRSPAASRPSRVRSWRSWSAEAGNWPGADPPPSTRPKRARTRRTSSGARRRSDSPTLFHHRESAACTSSHVPPPVYRLAGGGIDTPAEKYLPSRMAPDAAAAVADVYRADWGRIVATLIGLIGDFELAEEAAQEAFTAALEQWPSAGVPELPRAWIIKTARNKAID